MRRLVVYTAHSKHAFYAREMISAYVLEEGGVPLNPFLNFGYFLGDRIPRETVRSANNALVAAAQEVWAFGPVSNGVFHEVLLANKLGRPVRYFTVGRTIEDIVEVQLHQLEFEVELCVEVGSKLEVVQQMRASRSVAAP